MSHIWSASVSSPSSGLHGLVEYSSGILIKLFITGRAASKQSINKVAQNFSVKKNTPLSVTYMLAKLLTTEADAFYIEFLPLADLAYFIIISA